MHGTFPCSCGDPNPFLRFALLPHRGTHSNPPFAVAHTSDCLSVPSSSGNKLQRAQRVVTAPRPRSPFQSPPHRGTNCNVTRPATRLAGYGSFSPLLIGEQTATSWASPRTASPMPAFSPLLIGEQTATCDASRGRRAAGRTFSPLLIGEQTATRTRARRRATGSSPFSPLLIGEQTATLEPLAAAAVLGASAFSPLLIGEQTATQRQPRRPSQAPDALSVPSSSGNKLQLASTGASRASALQPLSVPSSSGNKLQRRRAGGSRSDRAPLSVPSSSGNKLQRLERVATERTPERRFQSPPHRGTNCNAASRRMPPAATHGLAFSPLLIGEQTATRCEVW